MLSRACKQASREKKPELGAGKDMENDYFADFPGDLKKLATRVEALERKGKMMDALIYEIANDLYKNTIQIVPRPRVKAAVFNEKERIIHKEILKDPNIIQIKTGFATGLGYMDVIFRDFSDPKRKSDRTTQIIEENCVKPFLETVPPYSPEGNILKAITRTLFAAVCH